MIKKIINVLTLEEYFALLGILVEETVLKTINSAEDVRLVLDAYSYQIYKRNQIGDYTEFSIDEEAVQLASKLLKKDNREFDLSKSFSSQYFLYKPNEVAEALNSNDKLAYIGSINVFSELPN